MDGWTDGQKAETSAIDVFRTLQFKLREKKVKVYFGANCPLNSPAI